VPGIYLPSLFGARNWQEGVAQTGRARTINREKFQLDALEHDLTTPTSHRQQVFSRYAALLRVRRSQAGFHPNSPQRILQMGRGIFGVERGAIEDGTRLVCLHNVTERAVTVVLPQGRWHVLYPAPHDNVISGSCTLEAYQCLWLRPDV